MRSPWSSRDARIILRNVGLVSLVVFVMTSLTCLVAVGLGESFALLPLGGAAAICLAVGLLLYLPFRKAGPTAFRHAVVTAAAGWLVVFTLGAVPLVLVSLSTGETGTQPCADFTNAFFESVSGFTTTGLTMVQDPQVLPRCLQWWRSFSQWIGGLGVIVVVLGFLGTAGTSTQTLFFVERKEKTHPGVLDTVRSLWAVYVTYTVCGFVGLTLSGMPLWAALNHSMTALSTGGFSTYPDSLTGFPGVAPQLIIVFLMLLGSISFPVHYQLLRGRTRSLWTDYQTRWQIILIAAFAGALFLENLLSLSPARAATTSLFHAVSAATTTGLQSGSLASLSDTAKIILIAAMFVGGAAGSTAGGIKVLRLVLFVRGASWRLRKMLSPTTVVHTYRLGQERLSEEMAGERVQDAALMVLAWGAFALLGFLVLVHTVPASFSVTDVMFEVASAQGTVGLSVGITQPSLPVAAKAMLCFNMWVGRVEIIPALALIRACVRGMA